VWTWAINSTSSSSKSDVTNKDDIDALATIEWCNRWLESQRIEYRIIFVTGAASFYGAARIRWGFAESHHLSAHTLARLGQAAHPFAYYVDLLTAGQGGSAGELSAAERYTPLRDVRYFLADPAFLAYARRSSAEPTEIAKSMVGANLTEWLQAVLLRLNKEDRYIAWNFMELSGIRMSPQGVDWQPVTVTSVVKEDIEVFEKKWQGFLQQASFNHLIDRGIRRRSLKLLVECFASYDKNEDDTYRLLSDYLHEAHIDVSRAATNLSIVALASKTRQGDPAPMDRCVPPLVLHRFPHAQAFVSTLLQTLRSPLGAQIQEHLETLKSNCFGVDAKHLYTRKYLDLLLRAYCFAIFREWKGALFLAKEAYLVTQLQIHQRNRLAAEDELTGREAAYLACVASRHPENFDSLRKFDQRCIDWLQYLERSIDVEEKIGKLGRDVIELHRARFSSEELAHELMYRFYSKWGDRSQGSDPLTTEVIDDLDSSFAHLVNKIVKLRSDWETGSDNAAPDRQELRVAQLFVLRQALINLAQTRFLLAEDWQGLEQHMSNEQVATLLEDANRLCETQFATTLPESDLHGHITALARHFAGRLKVRELEQVQRSLKEKIDALKTCTWALAYDSHKYQAILACISAQ